MVINSLFSAAIMYDWQYQGDRTICILTALLIGASDEAKGIGHVWAAAVGAVHHVELP